MTKEKILVVDDEQHIRTICSEILRRKSFQVTTFSNAQDALKATRTEAFDLLLTDISMPGMDGLELLHAIKEIHKEITSVAMTGFGTVENVVQCLHLGIHGFLVKPFTSTDLIQTIEGSSDEQHSHRFLKTNFSPWDAHSRFHSLEYKKTPPICQGH